ncbi:HDOD domain-containing protein [Pseudoalteromonas denitrificans]|uniref:HDOD domain-containing protein n=1 Tax=Pseudoalteromonas denitrificans DSM 6059 TaxID=1123010 RepID=A0A1I1FCD7_9GAMM|nr:HDOD domain-containing protein [Pseudoalteromonas denitrificans]SFB97129.1 HDOD domain-containing protein [Pseudoalteromonas denitrificans DSM 6059]
MDKKSTNKSIFWVEKITQQEMPALASTVRELENLAKDDTASLAKLGQAVLHDHALTSSVLKVANSSVHMSRNPVTTVSRAAVVLGLSTMKNICITSKLLSSLLKNKNLTTQVYTRLVKLMAQSFHAGMLAKMMVSKYDKEIQEQTFIAALLNRLGESAFWSIGGEITEKLDEVLQNIDDKKQIDLIVSSELGISFEDMSLGLARNWNLGDILINSLVEPQLRTPEIQSINFAVQLSALLADPKHSSVALNKLKSKIANTMGIPTIIAENKIQACSENTITLLHSYGASILTKFIHHASNNEYDFKYDTEKEVSTEALQLKILRELAFLPNDNADFNMVIQTTLEGIYRGIKMNRAMVLLRLKNCKKIEPRFISSKNAAQAKSDFTLTLTGLDNIFSHVLKYQEPIWVSGHNDEKYADYLNANIKSIVSKSGFFIAPLLWDQQCIGLFYSDKKNKEDNNILLEDDFMAFTLFVQQANLCLSLIKNKTPKRNV